MSRSQSQLQEAVCELQDVLAGVDESMIDAACETLARARHIGIAGCGRELLQMKGFAMRLFHMGLPVSVVGDVTMPPLGEGDVFLVAAGPGELATMTALMNIAKNAGAHNLLLTAQPESSAGRLADSIIVIPAQTMASDQGEAKTSVLPMGSIFEGDLFVLFEVMVLRLRTRLGWRQKRCVRATPIWSENTLRADAAEPDPHGDAENVRCYCRLRTTSPPLRSCP